MGLLSAFGFGDNPFYQAFDQGREGIVNGFAGMVGSGNDPRMAATGYAKGLLHGRDVDTENAIIAAEQAERQSKIDQESQQQNQTIQWLQQNYPQYAGLPAAQGVELAMADMSAARGGSSNLTTDQRNWMAAQQNPEFAAFLEKSGTEFGMTPIWGQFPDGSFGYGVQGKDGSFKQVDTGNLKPLDPRSLSSEKAAGSAFGKGQGSAVLDLPQAQWTADESIKEIDALMVHPGLDEQFGGFMNMNQMLPAYPGTNKASFQTRLSQAQGRTFLQAYEMLRGGGQITEVEGKKAEQAMARLSTSQTKEEFLGALRDFKDAIRAGLDKLQQQATMSPFAPASAAQPAGNQTSTGVTWSVTP